MKFEEKKRRDRKELAPSEMPLSEVKQEMKALFKRIRLCLEEGEMPSGKQVARFKELSVMFDYHSKDEEWFEDQLKFREKVKEFETAVESRNLPDAQRLVQEFRAAKKACHKVYRWKGE
ncbi:MAG: GAK system XXXCH domain-containing protein [Candidatus Hydrothermarchaeales archaeon]